MARDTDGQQPADLSKRRLTPDERVALARRIQAMTPAGAHQTDSTDMIREDRDALSRCK